MLRIAVVFFISMMASTAFAETNRTVLKRGDLTATDKESAARQQHRATYSPRRGGSLRVKWRDLGMA
jgi:hypothetical protein